jgi:hypothetical protein
MYHGQYQCLTLVRFVNVTHKSFAWYCPRHTYLIHLYVYALISRLRIQLYFLIVCFSSLIFLISACNSGQRSCAVGSGGDHGMARSASSGRRHHRSRLRGTLHDAMSSYIFILLAILFK